MNARLQGFGIAITRPIDQAKKLKQLIAEHRGQTIDFPLIEIAGLQDYSAFNEAIADLNNIDWLIFISSNAVQNALPRIKKSYPQCQNVAILLPLALSRLKNFSSLALTMC